MRTIKHSAVAAALVLTGGMAAGCGGGDDTDTPTTAVSTPVVTVTPGVTESATSAPPEKTATPEKTPGQASTATPVPTATNGLPKDKPEPGPPEQFTVVITNTALKANTKTVLQNKDMKALLINKSDKDVPIDLTGPNKFGLGSGFIEKGDRAPVFLRSLAAGSKIKIAVKGYKPAIVKVVAG